jgi:uncharacterized protein YabN with tetrapyrrole methylase and pyrophosphatase domain
VGDAGEVALARLDELTRRLRRDCPWDREQDARSIVSHTVEEAYELADAAYRDDDAKLLDELGDVLFQVHFLSLLLEERGAGDLAAVAGHVTEKLIRRHPHVFGDASADTPEAVRRNWEEIKRTTEGRGAGGLFGDMPENLPSLSLAARTQRRAGRAPEPARARAAAAARLDALADAATVPERFDAIGELLFAAVACARALGADPELALRQATARFRERVELDGQDD